MISIGTVIYKVVEVYLAYALGNAAYSAFCESRKGSEPVILNCASSTDDNIEDVESTEVE